jgi:PleD family two-component response regulator
VIDFTERCVAKRNIDTSHLQEHTVELNRSRVLIADDHNLVAELCKKILEPEFNVVGMVSNGHDVLRAAAELKPKVIILDIAMPVLIGLDAGRQVKE